MKQLRSRNLLLSPIQFSVWNIQYDLNTMITFTGKTELNFVTNEKSNIYCYIWSVSVRVSVFLCRVSLYNIHMYTRYSYSIIIHTNEIQNIGASHSSLFLYIALGSIRRNIGLSHPLRILSSQFIWL